MSDVTAERRLDQLRVADMMESLAVAWEKAFILKNDA